MTAYYSILVFISIRSSTGCYILCILYYVFTGVEKYYIPSNLLKNPSGNLSSPNYPNNYSSNFNADWTIEVPPEKFVLLNIVSFETSYYKDIMLVGIFWALQLTNNNKGRSLLWLLLSNSSRKFRVEVTHFSVATIFGSVRVISQNAMYSGQP